MASGAISVENNSNSGDDEFIQKQKSIVKNVIASDDENDDIDAEPLHTEDIRLCLSDDSDAEQNNPTSFPDDNCQRSNSPINSKDAFSNDSSLKDSTVENNSQSPISVKKKRISLQCLYDSDSEPEEISRQNTQSDHSENTSIGTHFDEEPSTKKKSIKSKKRRSMWDSDSDEEESTGSTKIVQPKKSGLLSSLIDSDSDDVDQPIEDNTSFDRARPTGGDDTDRKNVGKSKKNASGKSKRESSKDAMLTIRSESQRMTREAAISLPYHKPKQHSLSDFLNRRRFGLTSMKAPIEELIEFQKESAKEIKEFYKSESEHSDSGDEDCKEVQESQTLADEKKEDGAMETDETDLRSKLVVLDENEIKEGENKKETVEENEVAKECIVSDQDTPVPDKESESNNLTVANNETDILIEVEKKCAEDVAAKDAEEIKDELPQKIADETDENKCSSSKPQTDTCQIESQDLRLKLSEDLSEVIAPPKKGFEPMSDSDDEIQAIADPPKPTEQPKILLRGNPDDIIDLDDDFTSVRSKTEDLNSLMSRFMRHSLPPKAKASPKTLSVKVVDRDADGSIKSINQETLSWSVEETTVDNTPPGLKMKKLKQELQRQIIEQREKEFLEKEALGQTKDGYEEGEDDTEEPEYDGAAEADAEDDEDGDDNGDDEIDGDEGEDILDDEEEEPARNKKKNLFVDEEASVDGDDEDDENSIELNVKDDNEKAEESDNDNGSGTKSQFYRSDTNIDMFASQMSDDDDFIPGYQPGGGRQKRSPLRQTRCPATQDSSILSTNESPRLPAEITQPSPNSSFQRILHFDNDLNTEEVDMNSSQLSSSGLKKYSDGKKDGIMQLAQSLEVPETEADLMALCSGQFISQAAPLADSQDSQDLQLEWTEDTPPKDTKSEKVKAAARMVIESSDEEGDEEDVTKRKTRRLSFSDEESNSVDGGDDLGEDDYENDEFEDEAVTAPREVMYDSDENEIPLEGAAFLENEAELSEDDYAGSGDEDDEGDDKMEEELGDLDDIDQDKVQEELGRIHMRNLLDDDRRDVRLMQEMLLEDGELHEDGKGRQRQFRWKNADSATLLTSDKAGSDHEGLDEDDDDDGEWRQVRHAREMYLADCQKEKGDKTDEDESQHDSELMILGRSILKKKSITRIEVNKTASKPPPAQHVCLPDSPMKSVLGTTHSRGSFLARTSDVLTRLAQNATGRNGIVETKTKNSRNFVFAALSPPKDEGKGADLENGPRPNAKRKAKRSLVAQPEKKSCTSQPTKYSSLFDYL